MKKITHLTHSIRKLLLDSLFPASSTLLEFAHVISVTHAFFLLGVYSACFESCGGSDEGGSSRDKSLSCVLWSMKIRNEREMMRTTKVSEVPRLAVKLLTHLVIYEG